MCLFVVENEESCSSRPYSSEKRTESRLSSTSSHSSVSSKNYKPFWLYGKQFKGHKGKTFKLDVGTNRNPHEPFAFNDPVFDEANNSVVTHCGKARRGEGNDMTSDPKYLAQLGKEIKTLSRRMKTANEREKQNIHSK